MATLRSGPLHEHRSVRMPRERARCASLMNNLRTTTLLLRLPCGHSRHANTHPRGDPGTPTPTEKNQHRSLGPQRAYSLRAGVGRHRQPKRLRHLLRRGELHRNGDPLRHERHPRARRPRRLIVLGGSKFVGPPVGRLAQRVVERVVFSLLPSLRAAISAPALPPAVQRYAVSP